MNKSLIFCVILLVLCTVAVSAEIPSEILDQQIVEWDENQPDGDTRIMLLVNEEDNIFHIQTPSVEAKLAEFRLSSEDELKEIADAFTANSADMLEVSASDLKVREASLSTIKTEFDYDNPSGSVWYDQYYNGIQVYSGELGIHVNAYGTIFRVDYRLIRGITAPTEATLTAEEASEKAKTYYSQESIELLDEAKLYIIQNKVAWRLNIDRPVSKEAFFDAETGNLILDSQNFVEETQSEDSTGGPDVTGGEIEPTDLKDAVTEEANAAKDKAKPVLYVMAAIFVLLLVIAIVMFIVRKFRH